MPATGTSITDRAAPSRRFEDYILTRVVDTSVGLTEIRDSQFTHLSGTGVRMPSGEVLNIGDGGAGGTGMPSGNDVTSSVHSIGFDFQFDNVTYKQFVACVNGWVVLVDPTKGTFNMNEIFSGSSVNFGQTMAPNIKPTFTSQAVLLSPWFDLLQNIANSPENYYNDVNVFANVTNIQQGLALRPVGLDEVGYAVCYYNDSNSSKGRRLIIRWNSISQLTSNGLLDTVKFEVVLYENGTIEYRYCTRDALQIIGVLEGVSNISSQATIGIFMPNGTNRFRDFAAGLGYRDNDRSPYIYGGFVYDPSYVDTLGQYQWSAHATASFTIGLDEKHYWPGLNGQGAIFTFSPPVNRRKVLPRKDVRNFDLRSSYPLVARTGDSRLGTNTTHFNDQKAISFTSGVVVNYPTTLTRFFGGSAPGTLERQNLFAGDFLVTGSSVKSLIDPYVNSIIPSYTPAFNESNRPDQDYATFSSDFFATGSALSSVGEGFDQSLRSKTQIHVSLPVVLTTAMQTGTSAIYYYNKNAKQWTIPFNSFPNYTVQNWQPLDWQDPSAWTKRYCITEDARGFGPIGNIVSSGSAVPVAIGDQTDPIIGAPYTQTNNALALSNQFAKSIRNFDEYRPTNDETFTLPINSPFLIEKMVIDIPIQMGAAWFQDQTQAFQPLGTSGTHAAFDFAGPAITVALYRQIQLSANSDKPSMRDLILTGTITHVNDMTASVVIENFPPYDSTFQVRPVGFSSYAGPPGAVVSPNVGSTFSGSVKVECTALSAVGNILKFVTSSANGSQVLQYIGQEQLRLPSSLTSIAYVSPFGRGGTGFQQSGRSLLGKEYVTFQGLSDPSGQSATNPLYVSPSAITAQMSATLATYATGEVFNIVAAVPMISHYPQPYLVMPGDKLMLSVSKMRPFAYSTTGSIAPPVSGTLMHDVNLTHGTINITLYGSQVQQGVEFHDTLNQPLNTDGIHEIIGAEPVVDQFESAYRNEFSGSFTDNFVLGDMVTATTANGQTTLAVGDRYLALSKLNARNVAPLGTSSVELAINPFKSYRSQPWYQKTGNVRLSQAFSDSERYWDSLMPSIVDCFTADDSAIFIAVSGAFGGNIKVDPGISGTSYHPTSAARVGWMTFNYNTPGAFAYYGISSSITNLNWTFAYPFEPRYANANRQLDVSKTFLATIAWDSNAFTTTPIPPTAVNGLIFGVYGKGWDNTGGSTVPWNGAMTWQADVNLSSMVTTAPNLTSSQLPSQFYATGSSTTIDTIKALFGFGDSNSFCIVSDMGSGGIFGPPGPNVLLGCNHWVEFQDRQLPYADGIVYTVSTDTYGFSPIIRGWKYGVHSGLPTFSKAYWRRGKYGQFRDMLEQRPFAKYYESPENDPIDPNFQQGVKEAVVNVKFISADGRLTKPENTWSNNQSHEVTSSVPFIEGAITSRPTINPLTLNKNIISFKSDLFNNVVL